MTSPRRREVVALQRFTRIRSCEIGECGERVGDIERPRTRWMEATWVLKNIRPGVQRSRGRAWEKRGRRGKRGGMVGSGRCWGPGVVASVVAWTEFPGGL